MIRKALLPVAGLGTRMLPITKVVPKELLPILNRPTIEYIVQEIIQSGLDTIIFVISSGKEGIVDYFDINLGLRKFLEERNKVELLRLVERVESQVENLVTVRQKTPEGLGHAVLMGERLIGDEPFAVILGDDLVASDVPCLKQMLSAYLELSAKYEDVSLIALEEVPREDVSKYGIVDGERVSESIIRMRRVIEKPSLEEAPSNYAIIGRYILTPKVFEYLKKIPKRGGEYQLTDAIQGLIEDGYPVFGFFFKGMRLDTGNLKGYLKAILYYALQDPELREVVLEMIPK
jgi:UTP--glucose-1-phosphate uridylyltransferase